MARIIIQGAGAAKAELITDQEAGTYAMRCAHLGDEALPLSSYSQTDAIAEIEVHVDHQCPFRLRPGPLQQWPDPDPAHLYNQGIR